MELGLDFDDSYFTEKVRQKSTLTSYNAKVCYPEWFLSDRADNGRNDMATIHKFRGDYHYQKKGFESAIQCYKNSLDNLGIHNRTMRRELMESLARCYIQNGQFEVSRQYIEYVMTDCLTVEHYCQVLLLQQQLYRCSADLLSEVSVLHQLISIHPDNSQFWLKLTEVYEKIRDHIQPTSVYKSSTDTTSSRYQDQDKLNIHVKGDICETSPKNDTSKEGTDFVKKRGERQCTTKAGDCVQTKEHPSPVGCNYQDTNKFREDKWHLHEVREEQTSACIGSLSEMLSGYPIEMILLTCYVRTRLKLLSVQGTVGSFIKDKNIQLVEMLSHKIGDLSVKDSTLDHATRFIRRDITEEDTDDEESKPDNNQDIKVTMENRITADDFNNRWFSWTKEILSIKT